MPLRASEIQVGDVFDQVVVEDLKRTQLVMYAGASGDFHPFHSDETFARAAGFPRGVFAHGMLSMGLAGKLLTDVLGDGRLLRYGAQFRATVWPGDTLTARATVVAVREEGGHTIVDLDLSAVNQDGQLVLSGQASGRIDP